MKFETVKLGDIAKINMGQSPKSEFYNSDVKYPAFDTYTTKVTREAQAGDVIMSVRAPVGDLNIAPVNICLGRGVCSLRANNNNQDYLFYLLKHYMPLLINKESGTVFGSVNRNDICNLEINIPNSETQKQIAAILSALDDKIELNNKINENLKQQAQAIFKSWFVDFEPFGGIMPDNWKIGKLSEILKLKKNTIQPNEDESLPYLPIDSIPIKSLAIKDVRPNEEALSSLLRFNENDILIGAMRVYFHRVVIAPFNGITRTTCFILEPFNPKYFAYGTIVCNQDSAIDYAQKTSKGSTMPYAVWEGGLGEFEIPIPNEKIADSFNRILQPLLEKIKKSFFENQCLSALRDTLLPKLMNGEIDVSEVKI